MNRIAIWIVSFLAILAGFIFESLWIRIVSAFVLLIIIYVLCKRIKIQESEIDKKSNFYILISEAMLSNIFLSRTKDAWTYALSFASTVFFTCLIPLLTASSFNEFMGLKAIEVQVVFKVVLAFSVLAIIVILIHNFQNGYFIKEDSMKTKEEIIKNNMFDSDNTVILIFPKIEKGNPSFYVSKNSNWDQSMFFPYLSLDANEDINKKDDIIMKISQKFNLSFAIDYEYLDKMDHENTKLNSKSLPHNIRYKYLFVYPKSRFYISKMNKVLEESGYTAYTLENLKKDSKTIMHNGDVIYQVESKINLISPLVNTKINGRTKIIWNLYKGCSNGCAFCAYGSSHGEQSELSVEKAKKIIDSLTYLNIKEIDIATGNEVDSSKLTEIIEYAVMKLHNKISLTTTSDVLMNIDKTFLKKKHINIEMTYDYPQENSTFKYRPKAYSEDNYKLAKSLISEGISVSALVVLHPDLNNAQLLKIKKDLSKLKITDVLFLRLMPVGKQSFNSYPSELKRKEYYSAASKIVKENKKYRFHCALSEIYDMEGKKYCDIGIDKLGIDAEGKVYACPWAEHIAHREDSPFYLGDLLLYENALSMLSESENYSRILKNASNYGKACKVFTYLRSGDIFSNEDVLY
jgi:MoaA/NifB/PqqE/SkfB family radical SAM enzyme